MIDLSVPDIFDKPRLEDYQGRPRFRSILTEQERQLCDLLMQGRRGESAAAAMGVGLKRYRTILLAAARKIVDPPDYAPITKLIVWRAKQIGAVEAYLGLRDTDGNHIDDGILIRKQAEIEARKKQMQTEYAARIVGPRPATKAG